jgi:hypothetical protein
MQRARQGQEIDSSTTHLGFRCLVRSANHWSDHDGGGAQNLA